MNTNTNNTANAVHIYKVTCQVCTDGIFTARLIWANFDETALAAVTDTAERYAFKHGYTVVGINEISAAEAQSLINRGMSYNPIDDQAERDHDPSFTEENTDPTDPTESEQNAISTTESTAYVQFNFGSFAQVGLTLYDGLSYEECVLLRSADVESYRDPETGAWVKVTTTADEALHHLAELRNAATEPDPDEVDEAAAESAAVDLAVDRIAAARVELMTKKDRSAWGRGVTAYALDLLYTVEEAIVGGYDDPDILCNAHLLDRAMLNGAHDWNQYSWGGSALCYDGQIAERLCCPSELKKTRGGQRRPNSREEWLDVQARALYQAAWLVKKALRRVIDAEAA